jgi:hypothetical protein
MARRTARRPPGAAAHGDGQGEDSIHQVQAGSERPVDANHGALRERGHPLRHVFTRAIPTAQCMGCHMHQPNIFLNSFSATRCGIMNPTPT